MNSVRILAVGVALLSAQALAAQDPSRLVLTEKDGAYELVVPVSRTSLVIPKGQLQPTKPGGDSGPRYFSLEDAGHALIISGWFEPERAFKTMDEFWAGEERSLTQHGMQVQNVVRESIENWVVVFYDIPLPGGRSSNMRAELVHAGTWIDLHLSVTGKQSETDGRKTLRDALSAVRVIERK